MKTENGVPIRTGQVWKSEDGRWRRAADMAKDSELTNKDGIPLRVGQVWEHGVCRREIIDIRAGQVAYWVRGGKDFKIFSASAPTEHKHFHTLISDPEWGDMTGWRLVSEDEKEKHMRPECAEYFSSGKWYGYFIFGYAWVNGTQERVPIDFEWPEDKPVEDNPREINWAEVFRDCTVPDEWVQRLLTMTTDTAPITTQPSAEAPKRIEPLVNNGGFHLGIGQKVDEIIAAVNYLLAAVNALTVEERGR